MPERIVIFRGKSYTHRQMAALKRDIKDIAIVTSLGLSFSDSVVIASIRLVERSISLPIPRYFSFFGIGKTEFIALANAAEKFEAYLSEKKRKGAKK